MIPAKKNNTPRVGVLLINYNQWDLTEKCVISVLKSQGVQPIIGLVDNNSIEPAPAWVENTEGISFYRNPENSGFISGNNLAFRLVEPLNVDFVIMLNNDTEVEIDTLKLLVSCFSKHPDTGLVTPAITYAEDKNTIWHAGGTFIPGKMSVRKLFHTTSELPEQPVEVDQISGCAMMMRLTLFRKIGLQDPGPFMYHEDVEKSLQSQRLGHKNYLVPRARIIHHVSISTGGVLSPIAVYFTHRNRYTYAGRNLKKTDLFKFRIYYMAITVTKTIIYPLTGNGKLVYWMWLATKDAVLNKTDRRPKKLFIRKDK